MEPKEKNTSHNSPPEPPNFLHWKIVLFWAFLGIVTFIVVDFLLVLGGVALPGFFSIPPVSDAAKGQVIASAVAWVVGCLREVECFYKRKRRVESADEALPNSSFRRRF